MHDYDSTEIANQNNRVPVSTMLMLVCGAIFRAAGPDLAPACNALGGCVAGGNVPDEGHPCSIVVSVRLTTILFFAGGF